VKKTASLMGVALLWSLAQAGCGSAEPPPPTWTAPTVAATAGNTENFLTWTNGSTVGCFHVYWSTSPGLTTANGNRSPGACGGVFRHAGLTNGTSYYYLAVELRDGVEAWVSPVMTATPNGPVDLTAIAFSGQLEVLWTPLAGATSHYLYWSTTPGQSLTNMTRVVDAVEPYWLTGLVNGMPYFFRLSAVVGGVESPAFPEVSSTPTP
jgi:hypothetical protein